jgi:hypothetical protein
MNGLGGIAKGVSDWLGLPPVVGEVASMGVNALTGNIPGAVKDGIELFGGGDHSKSGGTNFTQPSPPAAAQPAGPSATGERPPGSDPEADLLDIKNGKRPSWMSPDQFAMARLQMKQQDENMKLTMVTNRMKAEYDMKMEIIRNMKL